MTSLFAPKGNTPNSTSQINNQNDTNAINYAQTMLQRSGGDAKAAFYLAAKERGIDPEQILAKARTVKDPRAMVQALLMRNPQMQGLMSLFSMMK